MLRQKRKQLTEKTKKKQTNKEKIAFNFLHGFLTLDESNTKTNKKKNKLTMAYIPSYFSVIVP